MFPTGHHLLSRFPWRWQDSGSKQIITDNVKLKRAPGVLREDAKCDMRLLYVGVLTPLSVFICTRTREYYIEYYLIIFQNFCCEKLVVKALDVWRVVIPCNVPNSGFKVHRTERYDYISMILYICYIEGGRESWKQNMNT